MNSQSNIIPSTPPQASVELLTQFQGTDLNDLCDATDEAIKAGGGFGWLDLPARDILERYWQGVLVMPARSLFVARLDGVICGTCQMVSSPPHNEAQAHCAALTTHFIAPWGRGHGLSDRLLKLVETIALDQGYRVINLDVRAHLDSAIALYERHGFERIGEHPAYAYVDGQVMSGYYYTKILR